MTHTIGFILEQTLGHRTHTDNLRAAVPRDAGVKALWGLVDWEVSGPATHVPLYRSNWTVRAGLRSRRLIRRMMQTQRVDALFIHTQVAAVLAGRGMQRIPTVVSLDATPAQYDELGAYYAHARGSAWSERQKRRLNVRCFRHARHLVTWSHWTKASLIEAYSVAPDKITVIPPGIRPSLWQRPALRTLEPGPVRILFVGGDFERKGGALLLAAFQALRAQQMANHPTQPPIELHLVTRTPVAAEAGVFVYADMEANSAPLIQLFHACDIFCLPTWGDCLPMVLSEAAAAGLPIVATHVGAIDEIVHDGRTGLLIAPGDQQALRDRLHRLIEEGPLRLQMGQAGAKLVRQSFDAEHNAQRLLDQLKRSAQEQAPERATSWPTYC